jgi:hypothetical protein
MHLFNPAIRSIEAASQDPDFRYALSQQAMLERSLDALEQPA